VIVEAWLSNHHGDVGQTYGQSCTRGVVVEAVVGHQRERFIREERPCTVATSANAQLPMLVGHITRWAIGCRRPIAVGSASAFQVGVVVERVVERVGEVSTIFAFSLLHIPMKLSARQLSVCAGKLQLDQHACVRSQI
jgi:hypothetical protein